MTTRFHDVEPLTVNPVHATRLQYRRARLITQIGGGSLIAIGLAWAVFFTSMGGMSLVLIDVLMVALGFTVLALTARGRTKQAAVLLYTAMFVVLGVFATWSDLPSAVAPRSVHTYFLTLAVSAYLVFLDDSKWLRLSVPLVYLAGFLFFDSTNFGIESPLTAPDTIRVVGTWVNNTTAIGLLFVMFNVMLSDVRVRDGLEAEFRLALDRGELVLYLQPQADTAGRIMGAEALMRWRHPLRGLVPPDAFIPMAEDCGLIVPAGLWAIETACRQLKHWSADPAMAHLTMSVNVSAAQVRRSDFVPSVLQVIEQTSVPVSRLKLELTESMLINDVESIIDKMTLLKARGVGFSLDDFGTGFSSLSYLKRLPLDQLKIDQAFVRDVLTDPNDAAIAHTIVDLGRNLGLHVIAEGVETEGQKQFLIDNGCTSFQGYLIGRPLSLDDFEALVRASGASSAAA